MSQIISRLNRGDQAPVITVEDIHGQSVNLSQFWTNGPTLMTFLRHFGCIHCRNRLVQLQQRYADLQAAGLQLVTLGLGQPKHAERYCGKLAPDLTCFAATSNDPYYAWGLNQGTNEQLLLHSVDILKASAKAFLNGQVQGMATGDARMLPGTFMVDRQGIIRYAYYSQYAGDDPSIDTLLEQAKIFKRQHR